MDSRTTRFLTIGIFCLIAFMMIQHTSGNAASKGIEAQAPDTEQLGGDTNDMLDTDSELSNMESDNNYAFIGGDDAEQKELLELEKQKQELELENQKMQLQQLENKQVEEAAPAQEVAVAQEAAAAPAQADSENNVKGSGLCNEQHNYNEKTDSGSLLNMADCNSDYYTLSDDYLSSTKQKIKPNELLPTAAVDMKGENFLNATLSQSTEQAIGKPTQVHRSRLNYDLRSTPANPQVEVSPWNMSTMEPDSDRRHFEIGTSANEVSA